MSMRCVFGLKARDDFRQADVVMRVMDQEQCSF